MRRRVIAGMVASVAVVALLSAHSGPDVAKNEAGVTTTTRCEEDMACWNPATMGDHQGFVCTVEADGSIQRWHDLEGSSRNVVPCPLGGR